MTQNINVSSVPEVVLVKKQRQHAWLRAFKTPNGIIGVVLLAIILLMGIMAVVRLTPYDPATQNVSQLLSAPNASHWMGTDQFGRDVFSRVASGLANSILIAIVSVAFAFIVGSFFGIVAGFYGGITDRIVGVVTNVLFAFPSLLLALALAATLQRSWVTVAIAIAVVYIPIFIRVSRGPVLSLRNSEYVLAAQAVGRSRLSTIFAHIVPNIRSILVVQITLSLSWAILTEAALSFLGFGTPPPAASLGGMVYQAQTLVSVAPWTLIFPGVALIFAVIGLNLLGDSLRVALEPAGKGKA